MTCQQYDDINKYNLTWQIRIKTTLSLSKSSAATSTSPAFRPFMVTGNQRSLGINGVAGFSFTIGGHVHLPIASSFPCNTSTDQNQKIIEIIQGSTVLFADSMYTWVWINRELYHLVTIINLQNDTGWVMSDGLRVSVDFNVIKDEGLVPCGV